MMGTGMVKLDNQIKPNKMTATLTFNLPEEQVEYNYTLNAARYKDALKDIMDLMRYEYKHGEHDGDVQTKIAELYDTFFEITEGLLEE
jgi:hypothetical protein